MLVTKGIVHIKMLRTKEIVHIKMIRTLEKIIILPLYIKKEAKSLLGMKLHGKTGRRLNNLLATTGTIILIIPLTIIIISFLFPTNMLFKIMSAFWGVAGTLTVLFSGIFTGSTITNSNNLRLFLVTKILTLEEKREIFKTTFVNLIDDVPAIKRYAYDQILLIVTAYHKAHEMEQIKQIKSEASMLKIVVFVTVIILALFLGFSIIRFFLESSKVTEGFQLVKESAIIAANTTTNLGDTQETVLAVVEYLKKESVLASLLPATLVSRAAEEGFKLVKADMTAMTARQDRIELNLGKLTEVVKKLSDNDKIN